MPEDADATKGLISTSSPSARPSSGSRRVTRSPCRPRPACAGSRWSASAPFTTSDGRREPYSPKFRTALVLTGAGTAGAYHAAASARWPEAGVRIDLVAGHGAGPSARSSRPSKAVPPSGARTGSGGRERLPASTVASRAARPRWLPRRRWPWCWCRSPRWRPAWSPTRPRCFSRSWASRRGARSRRVTRRWSATRSRRRAGVVGSQGVAPPGGVGARGAGRRGSSRRVHGRTRERGRFWWRVFGAPIDGGSVISYWQTALWRLIAGGARVPRPDPVELSRRYAEVLTENLGQPGFRELLVVVHDLDTRRDLPWRRSPSRTAAPSSAGRRDCRRSGASRRDTRSGGRRTRPRHGRAGGVAVPARGDRAVAGDLLG